MKRKRKRTIRNSFFGDLFGTKVTTYSVRKGKVAKHTSISRWLGYRIYENANGEFSVPELDSSTFDTKRDAQRFISAWVKDARNPGKRKRKGGTILYIKNPARWFSRM